MLAVAHMWRFICSGLSFPSTFVWVPRDDTQDVSLAQQTLLDGTSHQCHLILIETVSLTGLNSQSSLGWVAS